MSVSLLLHEHDELFYNFICYVNSGSISCMTKLFGSLIKKTTDFQICKFSE